MVMRTLCFRVTEFPFILRFRVGFAFYLSALQNNCLTVSFLIYHGVPTSSVKLFGHIKERIPNKLGTRNVGLPMYQGYSGVSGVYIRCSRAVFWAFSPLWVASMI